MTAIQIATIALAIIIFVPLGVCLLAVSVWAIAKKQAYGIATMTDDKERME